MLLISIFRKALAIIALAIGISKLVSAEVIDIDNDRLEALIEQGTPIIDIRRVDEWRQLGVIDNSHPLTFFDQSGSYDAEQWLDDAAQITSKEQALVLICLHGTRSKIVANWLSDQAGYSIVYNVRRGINHWIKNDKPTTAYDN